MLSIYNQFAKTQKDSKNIGDNFKIIFPTEDYVKESYLGVENAESIRLQGQYWDEANGFPKKSFYKLEGKNRLVDKNLFHAKFFIVN